MIDPVLPHPARRLGEHVAIAAIEGEILTYRETPAGTRYGVILETGAWLDVPDDVFDQLTLDV